MKFQGRLDILDTIERDLKCSSTPFSAAAAGRSAEELQEAAARSTREGDEEMPDDIRWIRSYVVDEGDGTVGTVCVYQATSPEAIREHAVARRPAGRRDRPRRRHRIVRPTRSPSTA